MPMFTCVVEQLFLRLPDFAPILFLLFGSTATTTTNIFMVAILFDNQVESLFVGGFLTKAANKHFLVGFL